MRIAIVDFGAYAFVAQLARALAASGHQVLYLSFGDFQGPKGGEGGGVTANLTMTAVSLGEKFQKYSFLQRRRQERQLGLLFGQKLTAFKPDVAIGANMPLDVFAAVRAEMGKEIPYVHWLQDIVSLAMKDILRRKLPVIGPLVAAYYATLEASLLRRSDAVIAITGDFFRVLSGIGLDPVRCHIIPNWAPLEDLPVRPRDNDWARAQGLIGKTALLYSGTMGLKHNPELIVRAAVALRGAAGSQVIVVSEGVGADYLRDAKARLGLDNLIVLPFQPIESLPDVLAAADVLTAFVEPGAGVFSVPSKLLTYLCASRAVLLAVPSANAAACQVRDEQLGVVVPPDDVEGYARAAVQLLEDAAGREVFAKRARAYAQANFDIANIVPQFERIFRQVSSKS